MRTAADVAASPTALEFGPVALGYELSLAVELSNGGRAPAELALAVDGPFTLSATPSSIDGASTVRLDVTFAPRQLGPAPGTLRLGPGLPEVALSAEGLAACVASRPCATPRFDFSARACAEEAEPEGAACAAPCFEGPGTCRGGYCLGAAGSCSDTDRCTIDACASDGSCLHPPVDCPVTDPCQATYCEPTAGCAHQSVTDGVPCGEATCESAHVCLGGQCQLRLRPNALADCRYTLLASGPFHTCAVTAGGSLRCWGDNSENQQGRGYPSAVAPPGLAVGQSDLRSIAAAAGTTWAARTVGGVVQSNGPLVLPMNPASLAAGLRGQVCGLEQGEVRCADADAGTDAGVIVTVAHDAIALSMSDEALCVVHSDGGVRCGTVDALLPVATPRPATAVATAAGGAGCALLGDAVYCWGVLAAGPGVLWDAGVTAVASTRWSLSGTQAACAATTRGIECAGADVVRALVETTPTSAPVRQLSLGLLHGCALLADGHVACWGNNQSGQLGERSAQPTGLQLLPMRSDWLGQYAGEVLIAPPGEGVLALDSATAQFDGGTQWWESTPRRLPGTPSSYLTGCPCVEDGGLYCNGLGPLQGPTPTACAVVNRDVCLATGDGTVSCYQASSDGGARERSSWDAGFAVASLQTEWAGTGLCALRRDGVVRCDGLSQPDGGALSLNGVSELCLGAAPAGAGGCARLDGGELRCWGNWVGSPTPRTPLGAWPIVRRLVCGAKHFCTLSGINIVQCWGDNEFGQLGLDGPASTQAVAVPMPEPVTSIAAGASNTCALLQSKKVVCWGHNNHCQLGQRVLASSARPITVTQ